MLAVPLLALFHKTPKLDGYVECVKILHTLKKSVWSTKQLLGKLS